MPDVPKPVVLVVLDGFGTSLERRGNAIAEANTPNLDALEALYPFTTLQASGLAIGLPWGEPGNSEVGHLTMGTGRAIYQHLVRIINAIHDGSFYRNPAFLHAAEHVRAHRSRLHLFGLVSSGSVHSYVDHLFALLEFAKRENLAPVYLHIITDGKDAPPTEALSFLGELMERIGHEYPFATIASLIGRFWAMDRDLQWDRIRKAYELLVGGKGNPTRDLLASLRDSYGRGISDEFIAPTFLADADERGEPLGRLAPGDALVLFNFREDSMREITESLAGETFDAFPRKVPENVQVVTMTEYAKYLPGVEAAFPPLDIAWPLARVLAANGLRQLHIAETEKYAHVTYFFNGGMEKPFPGEDRILVPSVAVPHFDLHPEMRAPEITQKIIAELNGYEFILGNYANADMVGHSGKFEAVVKAIEALDASVGELTEAVLKRGGVLVVTGDHGNAEKKIHPISGEPLTEHTVNPVPFYLVGEQYRRYEPRSPDEIMVKKKETGGLLADIAPTILELMRLGKPPEMTGKSLLPMLLK